ncbi:MAG TPA: 50S ribosomal protein L11 methyltransferase [Gammaproteobacteria bacterium]|nr:50S ribosomal protein L11 methyltransferase [Gammaproteobacteria bacterium]
MGWQQLLIDLDDEDVDTLEVALLEHGAQAVTLQDARDDPILEPPPGAHPLWDRPRLVALFDSECDVEAAVRGTYRTLGRRAPPHSVEPLEDRDWERAWMEDFRAMRFGRRLWVCPRGSTPPDPEAVNVMLDPGLAFGTGTHATTALCLEWLDANGADVAGEVIDYGCGSGILSIAAARLGARRVWAVDNDPQALLATRENAAHNAVAGTVRPRLPEELSALQADLLLANILAAPLIELADRIADRVRPGGHVVLSGILRDQAKRVADAYGAAFRMDPPTSREEWVRLSGVRREP